MGAFSGITTARSTQGGNYIRPGDYLFRVKAVKMIDSQMPGKDNFFIVEMKVLEASATDHDIKPNKEGSSVSWIVELPGKFKDLSLGNIKAFLFVAFNSCAAQDGEDGLSDEDEITDELCELAVGEDSPLPGVLVSASAFHKLKKDEKGVFTRVNWFVPDDLAELLEKHAA